MSKFGEKIKLTSYDELLGVNTESEGTKELDINLLREFKNHPFKVLDDERMNELVSSIRERGILSPILVRKKYNFYEVISGHRRKRAAEIIGLEKVPVIIKELTDDDATIIMVDSNIQREKILPSEKAFAFKMKMDAISHMGKRGDRSREIVGEDNGLGGRQVTRYVKLTNLIAELLDMVDQKKLTITLAVKIADLSEEKQKEVLNYINQGYSINDEQIKRIREMNKENKEQISDVVENINSKPRKKKKVILPENKLEKYFPKDYSKKDMEEIIYQLLEKWKSEGYGI